MSVGCGRNGAQEHGVRNPAARAAQDPQIALVIAVASTGVEGTAAEINMTGGAQVLVVNSSRRTANGKHLGAQL